MHVTACLEGQKVEVEVGEDCRTVQALKEAIVVALPQLCVEGFDVSVGGRGLDDEGVVSLEESVDLDVVPNTRVLSVLALREAGREVSEDELLRLALDGDVALCTLYLDAGVPVDCVDLGDDTPLHLSCYSGSLELATLLLDRGSRALGEKNNFGDTPLLISCIKGKWEFVRLFLDRGVPAIDEKNRVGDTPLHLACKHRGKGRSKVAALFLDRGSRAIDVKNNAGDTPLLLACLNGNVKLATLLLDRGGSPAGVEKERADGRFSKEISELLLDSISKQ